MLVTQSEVASPYDSALKKLRWYTNSWVKHKALNAHCLVELGKGTATL